MPVKRGHQQRRLCKRIEGDRRPIVDERERARMLAVLTAVDAVVIFGEPTPFELVLAVRPDVIIKGGRL